MIRGYRGDARRDPAPLELERAHPDRGIAVVIPELIVSRWYQNLFEGNRARLLRMLLLAHGSDRVVVITTAFHLHDEPAAENRRTSARAPAG